MSFHAQNFSSKIAYVDHCEALHSKLTAKYKTIQAIDISLFENITDYYS